MTGPHPALTEALRDRYEVGRELGRGGMATVHLARDLRHDRHVALKVLLPELAAVIGSDRFLSEIRVTARLQHPNILPLFDSGEAGGLLFYTMPYVDGESLRARLARERQLPLDEALRIATTIAGALDYAHRQGVVHRDLKPENILLADGTPVVADFGIALAVSQAGGARITQTGLSLGTPQYMSPEQATGDRALDGRTDIYSLGVVLYEMLAGDPPHLGSTAQAVIAKVLTETPRSTRTTRPAVPAHVDAAVSRALAKLPADRWQTASQFGAALENRAPVAATAPVLGTTALVPFSRLGARAARWLPLSLAALLGLLAAGIGVGLWKRPAASIRRPVRFTLETPAAERMVYLQAEPLAFAPDGRTIVYVGRMGGTSGLYLRSLGELSARRIAGSEGAQTPFFSPDSRWVAFVVPGSVGGLTLKRVPVGGGTVTTVAQIDSVAGSSRMGPGLVGAGGAWSRDGIIVLGSERGLFALPDSGGEATRVTVVDTARRELIHASPKFFPDGKRLVFWTGVLGQPGRLVVASLSQRGQQTLLDQASTPLGFVGDVLVFGAADGTLSAVRVSPDDLHPIGDPVPVLPDTIRTWITMSAALSSNGSLVYARGGGLSQLALVDARGRQVGGAEEWRPYSFPRISPDGSRIAVTVARGIGTSDVWIYDLASGAFSRFTTGGRSARPDWSSDGRRLAYLTNVLTGTFEPSVAQWAPADGSGNGRVIYRATDRISEITLAPDGRHAVLRVDNPATGRDILLLPLAGDSAAGPATPLVRTPFNELQPRVSPDGRRLAYVSDETGGLEVYVRPFPGPGGRVQVSAGGGSEPAWSRDGRLFYRDGTHFISATLAPGPRAAVVARQELFEDRFRTGLFRPQYDVHPDGQRFAVLRPMDEAVVVVLDWADEVRARVTARAAAVR
jgi:serine/threonine-protein kinase